MQKVSSSSAGEALLALEHELHRTRLAVVQLEAQRDFLVARLTEQESLLACDPRAAAVSVSVSVSSASAVSSSSRRTAAPPAKKRARTKADTAPVSAVAAAIVPSTVAVVHEDRTGLCTASLNKSGKLCRRKATTNFSYCGYHLPLDPSSGFMYCTHTKAGGKSCGNPVPINSDRLCKYHKVGGIGQPYQDESDSDSDSD